MYYNIDIINKKIGEFHKKYKESGVMRKILSIILSLCMMVSLCTGLTSMPVFASEADVAQEAYAAEEIIEEEAELSGTEDEVELFAYEFEADDFNPFYDEGTGSVDTEKVNAGVSWNWEHCNDPIIESNYPTAINSNLPRVFDNIIGTGEEYCFTINDAAVAEWNENNYQNNTGAARWRKSYITVDMGEAKTFSGVRIYGRGQDVGGNTIVFQDGTGSQNMAAGNIYVSGDGENWYPADKLNYVINQEKNLVQEISTSFGGNHYNITARYIRVEATQICSYTTCGGGADPWSLCEIRLVNSDGSLTTKTVDELKDGGDFNPFYNPATGKLAPLSEIGEAVEWGWEHQDDPNIIASVEANKPVETDAELNSISGTNISRVFDNIIGTGGDYCFIINNAAAAEYRNIAGEQWRKSYITVDMGEAKTFSGVRVYGQRQNMGGNIVVFQDGTGSRNMAAGNIYVSDTGLDGSWVKADKLNYTGSNHTNLVQEIPTSFDGNHYNITARYIRVEATQICSYVDVGSGPDPWSLCEIRLVYPDEALTTKTVEGLKPSDEITNETPIEIDLSDANNIKISDITFTEGAEVTSVTMDDDTLTEGTHYTIDGNKIVLAGIYAKTLALGTHTLAVTFEDDSDEITVNVIKKDYYDPAMYIDLTNTSVASAAFSNTGMLSSYKKQIFDGVKDFDEVLAKDPTETLDGNLIYSYGWHSDNNASGTAEEILAKKKIIIDFAGTDAISVGGVRIYPSLHANVITPKTIKVTGIYANGTTKVLEEEATLSFTRKNLVSGEYFDRGGSAVYFDSSEDLVGMEIVVLTNQGGANNYTLLMEVEVLRPITKIAGEIDTFTKGAPELEEDVLVNYETYPEGTELSKVYIGSDELISDEDYTAEEGVVTLKKEYLGALSAGEHTVKLTFENGDEATGKLTVAEVDVIEDFKYFRVNEAGTGIMIPTGTITLKNVLNLTVTKITPKEDINTEITFTQATADADITITRSDFRKAVDSYSKLGKDTGIQELSVTFESGTTITYVINLEGGWYTKANYTAIATNEVLREAAADEIDLSGNDKFAVRADSVWNNAIANHPVAAFFNTPKNTSGQGNYHCATDEGKIHYIDVDFGSQVTVGGLRYQARVSGASYEIQGAAVTIYGATEFGNWSELYNGKATAGKKTSDFIFNENTTLQYVRIYLTGVSYPNADALSFLKPISKITSEALSFETAAPELEADVAVSYLTTEGNAVAKVEIGETELSADDYTKGEGTVTIKKDAISDLAAGNYTVKLTFADGVTAEATLTITEADVAEDFKFVFKSSEKALSRTNRIDFKNIKGAPATKVTLKSDPTKEFTFSNDENYTTISITRGNFRKVFDAYEKLGLETGEVELLITFGEQGSVTYKVNLLGDFITKSEIRAIAAAQTTPVAQVDRVFAEDEIDVTAYSNFGVRTDSVAYYGWANHPINVFVNAPKDTHNSQNYHAQANNGDADLNNSTDGTVHYIDVDFGEATEIGGLRYQGRLMNQGYSPDWRSVEIYGATEFGTWTLLYEGSATNGQKINDFKFNDNHTVRFVRIKLEGMSDAAPATTADGISFLKPIEGIKVKVESVGGTISGGVTGDNVFQKGVETTLTATPDANSTFKYWIEVNTGKIITTEAALTLSGNVGRSIKAIFQSNEGRQITFYGKNAKTILGFDTSTLPGEEPSSSVVPDSLKAYVAGYSFLGWKLDNRGSILTVGSLGGEGTSYYAAYEEASIGNFAITLGENASIYTGEDASAVPYGESVGVTAPESTDAGAFMYWTLDGKIVSYNRVYNFTMPAKDINLTPVFGNEEVVEAVQVTLSVNGVEKENGDGTNMAGFMVSRYIPEGTEVLETGIIYVRDASYGDLDLDKVGKTAVNGKTVNVSISNIETTGQYKFNARYEVTTGIKAIAFITYKVGGETKTEYSDAMTVAKE